MSTRRKLEALAETAIELLDRLDGDADLEDGDDAEPPLGWPESHAPTQPCQGEDRPRLWKRRRR